MDLKIQGNIKSQITSIVKIKEFNLILKKLTIWKQLIDHEREYILSIALMFLEYYSQDKRKITYCEFAYYIVLKYSILHDDYKPLYDFSTSLGFYPTSKFILDKNLIKNESIFDFLVKEKLDAFNNWEYIETLEQNNIKTQILKSDNKEISFIAPTSYWKSSIILEYLNKLNLTQYKIGIIVPSKSLIKQTYKIIKEHSVNVKILIHDEMYTNNDSFIAVFTQERALRLLKKNKWLSFDVLFIDEAHNLFEKDPRNILLSRLISKNILLNQDAKYIYLSPLITDSNNLKVNWNQTIDSYRIDFNIKEPELYQYTKEGNVYKHNRFVIWWWNDYKGYKIWEESNYLDYILRNSWEKNFIYHMRPKIIEDIALDLIKFPDLEHLPNSINEVISLLEKEVNKDFYIIELLKKWIVYIHWQIPDLIKEYLEFKFKEINELKYIIANSVILEWINLPIDTLFILHTPSLVWKKLINLVGRVNRLNYIFSESNDNLEKLLPKIHFLHTYYEDSRVSGSQMNRIKDLRNTIFEDKVSNPTLEEFDIEKNISWTNSEKQKQKDSIKKIQENEKFLLEESDDEKDQLKKYLIENWINNFYKDKYFNKVVDRIFINLQLSENLNFNQLNYLEKINKIFIENHIHTSWLENESYIKDYEIERLWHEKSREYYHYFIEINLKKKLKDNIVWVFDFFKKKSSSKIETDRKFYFGRSYWNVMYDSIKYPNSKNLVYVDVGGKSDKKLINLAIVKIKLEENFINFKLNKLIVFLYDYQIISEEEYNSYIYWTEDKNIIKYINQWLTPSLTKRLKEDDQLKNILTDSNGNLKWNSYFTSYKECVDNFYKFELERFIN